MNPLKLVSHVSRGGRLRAREDGMKMLRVLKMEEGELSQGAQQVSRRRRKEHTPFPAKDLYLMYKSTEAEYCTSQWERDATFAEPLYTEGGCFSERLQRMRLQMTIQMKMSHSSSFIMWTKTVIGKEIHVSIIMITHRLDLQGIRKLDHSLFLLALANEIMRQRGGVCVCYMKEK